MSIIWNHEKLWSLTEYTLRRCDRVVEKLMDFDGETNVNCPLDEHEIKECHKALALCGLILSRVFADSSNKESALADFVFRADTELAEKLIVRGNNAYIKLSNQQEDALDQQHEVSDRVRRGIAWLDTRTDLGTWEPMITEGSFNIKNPCDCVGGNIFGKGGDTPAGDNGFKRLCKILEGEGLNPVDLGFAGNGNIGDMSALQTEWIQQVGERL